MEQFNWETYGKNMGKSAFDQQTSATFEENI